MNFYASDERILPQSMTTSTMRQVVQQQQLGGDTSSPIVATIPPPNRRSLQACIVNRHTSSLLPEGTSYYTNMSPNEEKVVITTLQHKPNPGTLNNIHAIQQSSKQLPQSLIKSPQPMVISSASCVVPTPTGYQLIGNNVNTIKPVIASSTNTTASNTNRNSMSGSTTATSSDCHLILPSSQDTDTHSGTTTISALEAEQQKGTSEINHVATKPSSLVTVPTSSPEITSMWQGALSRLGRLTKMLVSLETAVQGEFQDLSNYDAAVKQSTLILHDVSHNLRTAKELIAARNEQLQDANKRFRILTADDLSDCSTQNLEDISDVLWSGLQAATLALSRRQDSLQATGLHKSEEGFGTPTTEGLRAIQLMTENVPEARFEPAPTPKTSVEFGKAEELCTQIVDVVQTAKDVQNTCSRKFKALEATQQQLEKEIKSANAEYDTERTNLINLEKKLDTRLRQVNRMTGRDSYESLTVVQLADLCKTINKASRRLATEQAIREVKAQQGGEENAQALSIALKPGENPKNCLVCFEREWNCTLEPCQHNLCEVCATRLKFCPHCRHEIKKITLISQKSEKAKKTQKSSTLPKSGSKARKTPSNAAVVSNSDKELTPNEP